MNISDSIDLPWQISYHDGSGNGTRIRQDSASGRIYHTYSPVTPAMSSSGIFNGGPPVEDQINLEQANALWEWIRIFVSSPAMHTQGRAKGTGLFYVSMGASDFRFVVRSNPELVAFDQFLAQLRLPQ